MKATKARRSGGWRASNAAIASAHWTCAAHTALATGIVAAAGRRSTIQKRAGVHAAEAQRNHATDRIQLIAALPVRAAAAWEFDRERSAGHGRGGAVGTACVFHARLREGLAGLREARPEHREHGRIQTARVGVGIGAAARDREVLDLRDDDWLAHRLTAHDWLRD